MLSFIKLITYVLCFAFKISNILQLVIMIIIHLVVYKKVYKHNKINKNSKYHKNNRIISKCNCIMKKMLTTMH